MNPQFVKINHTHATYFYPAEADSTSSDEELTRKVDALAKECFPAYQSRPQVNKPAKRPEVHYNAPKQEAKQTIKEWTNEHWGD